MNGKKARKLRKKAKKFYETAKPELKEKLSERKIYQWFKKESKKRGKK